MVLGRTDKAWFTFKDCINYVKPQGMCVLKSVNKYRRAGGGKGWVPIQKRVNQVFDRTGNLQSPATLLSNSFGFYFYLLTFSPSPWAVEIPLIVPLLALRPFFNVKKIKTKNKNTSHQIHNECTQSTFWRFTPHNPFLYSYCNASSKTQLSDGVAGDSAVLSC